MEPHVTEEVSYDWSSAFLKGQKKKRQFSNLELYRDIRNTTNGIDEDADWTNYIANNSLLTDGYTQEVEEF